MSVITDIVVAVHLRVEGNVKNQWDKAAWQQPVLNRFFWRYFNGGGFRVLTPLPRMCEARLFRTLLLLFLIHNTYEMHVKPSLEKAQCDRLLKKMFLFWSVISWSHLCRPGLLLYPVNSWCYPANSQVYSTNITRPKFIACSDSLKVSYFAFNIFLVIRE